MKLKMAKNSMFAVLLRSPWWISIVVSLLFALAARALLPEPYVPFGVMGGVPFLVIGAVAAFRQFRAPGEAEIARTLQSLADAPWRDFSVMLETAFRRQGFTIEKPSHEAADLQLTKAGRTTLVTARRWKASNHGVEPLRALVLAKTRQDASHCTYVSLAELGEKARRFATENQIDLLSGTTLVSLLRQSPR